jgi:hypothetical protein
MAVLPDKLASYLAKKITRRAFSVYRSNIAPPNQARLQYNRIRRAKVKDGTGIPLRWNPWRRNVRLTV